MENSKKRSTSSSPTTTVYKVDAKDFKALVQRLTGQGSNSSVSDHFVGSIARCKSESQEPKGIARETGFELRRTYFVSSPTSSFSSLPKNQSVLLESDLTTLGSNSSYSTSLETEVYEEDTSKRSDPLKLLNLFPLSPGFD